MFRSMSVWRATAVRLALAIGEVHGSVRIAVDASAALRQTSTTRSMLGNRGATGWVESSVVQHPVRGLVLGFADTTHELTSLELRQASEVAYWVSDPLTSWRSWLTEGRFVHAQGATDRVARAA